MKYFALLLLTSCLAKSISIKPGECVLGRGMAVWQLLREDDGKYLFMQFPLEEGSKVEIVEDLSTYKKVECRTPR